MQTNLLTHTQTVAVEAPADIASDRAATVLPAQSERISERGWFLRAVLAGSLLLVAGFWTAVGMAAVSLLP